MTGRNNGALVRPLTLPPLPQEPLRGMHHFIAEIASLVYPGPMVLVWRHSVTIVPFPLRRTVSGLGPVHIVCNAKWFVINLCMGFLLVLLVLSLDSVARSLDHLHDGSHHCRRHRKIILVVLWWFFSLVLGYAHCIAESLHSYSIIYCSHLLETIECRQTAILGAVHMKI